LERPITSQELAANCSLVIRLPDGNLTGQFAAIAGPAPQGDRVDQGTGRLRTAVAALACTALRVGRLHAKQAGRTSAPPQVNGPLRSRPPQIARLGQQIGSNLF
jgi:hypothetical protein